MATYERFIANVSEVDPEQAADGRFLMVRHRDPTDPPDRLEVALVHGSELRTDLPVLRAGLTPLGSFQASRDWSSC